MEAVKRCVKPLKLEKNRVRRPFKGGLLLDEWQHHSVKEDGYRAEEWVASMVEAVHPDPIRHEGLSIISSDTEEKVLLKTFIEQYPVEMLGHYHVEKYGANMGILIKVLDSYSRLLIQVHPTKTFAKEHFNSEYGKTEAWHILGTRKTSEEEPYVLLGFKEGISREKWIQLFEAQDIKGMMACLHRLPVKQGDTFLVEGGMPHAAGAGVFFVEIQEPTDITFRTERKNLVGEVLKDCQLHQGIGFEKMFDCFHYIGYTKEEVLEKCCIKSKPEINTFGYEYEWIIHPSQCMLFSAYQFEVKDTFKDEERESFSVAIVVSGNGRIKWKDGELAIQQADELFLPAALDEVVWEKEGDEPLRIIQCLPPCL